MPNWIGQRGQKNWTRKLFLNSNISPVRFYTRTLSIIFFFFNYPSHPTSPDAVVNCTSDHLCISLVLKPAAIAWWQVLLWCIHSCLHWHRLSLARHSIFTTLVLGCDIKATFSNPLDLVVNSWKYSGTPVKGRPNEGDFEKFSQWRTCPTQKKLHLPVQNPDWSWRWY